MNLQETQQKIKIRIDKNMWDVITGQIVVQRRTTLPVLAVGIGVNGNFNRAAQNLIGNNTHATFYKLPEGIILVEFGKTGAHSLSKHITAKNCTFGATKLKKYIFNNLNNKKAHYHFYLHPTDRPNIYVLKELQNSWE